MKKIILGIFLFSLFSCSTDNDDTNTTAIDRPTTPEQPTTPEPPKYCDSTGKSTVDETIGKVVFGSINNGSTGKSGYEDFTSLSTHLQLGSNTTITLTPSFHGQYGADGYGVQFFVYIDYNQDGDFGDTGEAAWISKQGTDIVTGNITIPTTALIGSTRMRIAMRSILSLPGGVATSTPKPGDGCGTFDFGQVEDYSVRIIAKL